MSKYLDLGPFKCHKQIAVKLQACLKPISISRIRRNELHVFSSLRVFSKEGNSA